MPEIEWWLLPEWWGQQRRNIRINTTCSAINLYGSALDQQFWELAWHLMEKSLIIRHSFTLNFILLPISRAIRENTEMKQQIEHIFLQAGSFAELKVSMAYATQHYIQIIQTAKHKLLVHDSLNPPQPMSDDEFLFRQNQYLFGNVAAQFLQKVHPLPLVEFKGQYYHGIPFGLDLDTFLDSLFLPA